MIESVKKQKNDTFLSSAGPFWAINRPSRGHGWLSLLFLWRFGTTNVHFGAKSAIFRAFSLEFPAGFPGFSMQNRFWIEGCPDSQLTCRCALKMAQEDSQRDQRASQRPDRASQTDREQTDQREQTERFPDRDGRPAARPAGPSGLGVH